MSTKILGDDPFNQNPTPADPPAADDEAGAKEPTPAKRPRKKGKAAGAQDQTATPAVPEVAAVQTTPAVVETTSAAPAQVTTALTPVPAPAAPAVAPTSAATTPAVALPELTPSSAQTSTPTPRQTPTTIPSPTPTPTPIANPDATAIPIAIEDADTEPVDILAEIKRTPPAPVPEDAPAERFDAAPDSLPPGEHLDDVYAAEDPGSAPHAAPTKYGPSLDHENEPSAARTSITEEVREIERRVKARLTPALPVEKRRKIPFGPLWRRWRDVAMANRSDVVDPFGKDETAAARSEPLMTFLYDRWFRVAVSGAENLPAEGRGLIVANHSGTVPYDSAMLMQAVARETDGRREVRPLVEDFIFHFPFLGPFLNRLGGVRACQENAERLLAEDQLVAVFPEGVKGIGKLFRKRYQLQRFGRGGFIRLALRTGAPIIPAAIVGAEEIHPMLARVKWLAKPLGLPYLPITPTFPILGPLGLIPLPAKWSIRFGAPIDLASLAHGHGHGPAAADDTLLVNKLAETVRQSIQSMVDGALSERKSILLG